MITNSIPHKSRFMAVTVPFQALFSEVLPGRYVFTGKKPLIETLPNTVYLIERISVSGDMSENLFLQSITVSPEIRFKKRITGEIIHNQGIPLNKFYNGLDVGIWFKNDTEGEGIDLEIRGTLKQISETVGKTGLALSISCLIWAIDEREYNKAFRDTVLPTFSDNLRRG